MEPILDETSLVPCPSSSPATRVLGLARVLRCFDSLGACPVLRSVCDAADRDVGGGSGLRRWCFAPGTDRDAGRLVAGRLAKQPFIDGEGGLFAAAEGTRAVEARMHGILVFGAGFAALTDGVLTALPSAALVPGGTRRVDLTYVDEDGERSESVDVPLFVTTDEVEVQREVLIERLHRAVVSGPELLDRLGQLFPRVRLGQRAVDQIAALSGNEPVFRQLLRHLRALDEAALDWPLGADFEPRGVTFSDESNVTLNHGSFGPMRDFPVPSGFRIERWRLKTKLTGGSGARLYFRPERTGSGAVVLVGYFGDHLPTMKFRT